MIKAQDTLSNTQGISVHFFLRYSNWGSSSPMLSEISVKDHNGAGFGLGMSYPIFDNFSIFTSYQNCSYDFTYYWTNYRTDLVEGGIQYDFRNNNFRLRPYVRAKFGYNELRLKPVDLVIDDFTKIVNADLILWNFYAGTEVGFQYFLNRNVLTFGISGRTGKFKESTLNSISYIPKNPIGFRFFGVKVGIKRYFSIPSFIK